MRQFFKILFACFCALILFVLVTIISFGGLVAGLSSGSSKPEVSRNSVLSIDLNDAIQEQSEENSLSALSGDDQTISGLNDMLKAIKAAKTDDKIKGIYIKTGMCNAGWASLQEIRNALLDFKSSKKFIMAYGELADQKSYYVASAGDQVYLNPSGGIEFNGLAITGTFFKKALDKLEIGTEAFHCGQYKGAYEPFKLEKFSEPNRFQLGVLLNDINTEFLHAVASKTSIDTATLKKMANDGSIKFPTDALNNKMLDGLVFSDSIEQMIKKKLGLKEKEKIEWISTTDYAQSIPASIKIKDKIAIIYASGEIHDGEGNDGIYSKNMTKTIRKIANDETVKAVVLRVNSPGGSALASEILFHELMQLKKKKPLVVSMGDYAASGGYYMACAGDSIFAEQTTLTGSIGVVGVMFNMEGMMKNKIGVTFDQVKTAQYADFPNMTRTMTPFERNWIQSYLDSTYNLFKKRVGDARKMDMAKVEEIAQGHVYSGTNAKQIQLVDDFGNTNRALQSAAAMAKLKEYRIVEYPKPVDEVDELLSKLMGSKKEDAIAKKLLGADYKIFKELQMARNRENRIMTKMPFEIEIR